MRYAIIGGTGVYNLESAVREGSVETPYGAVDYSVISSNGREIIFLPRHGKSHGIPPHKINYRGNLWALKELGVEYVLSTVAVGSLLPELRPGELVLLGDFIDFTKGRIQTFYEGAAGVAHVAMAEPYCPMLRERLKEQAALAELELRPEAVYVCTEGPRFETAAEIRFYRIAGGEVVGMTSVPEVVLAKELGLCYASVGIVTNMATGMVQTEAGSEEILAVVESQKSRLGELFLSVLSELEADPGECSCASALMKL